MRWYRLVFPILVLGFVLASCRERDPAAERYADSVIRAARAKPIRSNEDFLRPERQVFDLSVVQERPELLSAPTLEYPPKLKRARVEGRVVVQAILDTTGRVEPASLQILSTPDSGFAGPVRNYMLHARFSPARNYGQAVRVRLTQPIDFRIP